MYELTEAQKKLRDSKRNAALESPKKNINGAEVVQNVGKSPKSNVDLLIAKVDRLQKTIDNMDDSKRGAVDMSGLLLGVPVIFTFLVFWGGASYYFLGSLISAMVIMTEASNAPKHRVSNLSGIEWFVISSVFWFFTYPYYMMRRSRVGLSNMLLPGIILAIIFAGSFVYKFGESMRYMARAFM